MPLTVHRIVLTDPATLDDFASNAAKGRAPRGDDPEVLRLWDGLSVYATLAQARRKARGAPYLGRYIAELRIPDGAGARVERTPGTGPSHALGRPGRRAGLGRRGCAGRAGRVELAP